MGDDWMALDEEALKEQVLKLTRETSNLADLKSDADMEAEGVDSMDASGIQKDLIKKLPGYDIPDETLIFMGDDCKTVDAFCEWLKEHKK
mmetsp:Transcript_6919/g.14305  ORF Transcript_6919/g.14305 Transcript_6919/m.14305 type:complete len:90 (+) Transcript_6919:35-304(+)